MNKLLFNEQAIKNKSLICLQINLLNKCTSKCKSCRKYTWPDDELPADDVKNLIKWFANQGGQTIVFSGGDPILYSDFEDVAVYAESLGIKWSVFTTLITKDIDKIRFLAEHAYRLHISIDAIESEQYKFIRGVNAWEIVDSNLRYLQANRKNKIPVRISSTITSFNYDKCIDLYKYANANGMLIKFYPAQKWIDVKSYDEHVIGMNKEQLKEFYSQMCQIAKMEQAEKNIISNAKDMILSEYYFDIENSKHNKCLISTVNASINANGDIYPCCKCLDDNGFYNEQLKYVYGNIKGKTPKELSEIFSKRYNPNCKLFADCFARYGAEFIDTLFEIANKQDDERNYLFI